MAKFPLGGAGGIPFDMVTHSAEVGKRTLKTTSQNELATANEEGRLYSINTSYNNIAVDGVVGVNLQFAADSIIRKIITTEGFIIEIVSGQVSGTADGIFQSEILNRCLSDVSPSSAQLFYPAIKNGITLDRGVTELESVVKSCSLYDTSIILTNKTGSIQNLDILILFEEVGERLPLFGLTPSTEIFEDTEMSIYG